MAFVKKTWKDRIVQYANRRLLTKSGGEVEQVTVTRDEGTVTEAGDKFDAATMNDLEDRLEYAFDNVSTAIECTQAEYDTWKNAGQLKPQTSYIITDAPNLNPTASDIEYSSGVTVADKLLSLDTNKADKTLTSGTVTASSNVTVARYTLKQFGNIKFLSLALYVTVAHSSGAKLASLSIAPTQMLDMVAVAKPSQNAVAWNVDTDGYLYTNDSMATGQTYYLNAWYI